jgi:NAD(P)-dependent dehydrogenase (short-subunit alcohol dehydrogenase family)
MDDKTCIVTGGNAGIGKAIAVALAKMQIHVVITSRDQGKGETALTDIKNQGHNLSVELVIGNLDTMDHTKQLAQALIERYPRIGLLVNNAGVWMTKRALNADGLEYCFMVNHMAPFILSNLLLDRLRANSPARIVNVSAGLYMKGKLDLEMTPYGKDFNSFTTYANTKLCNVLFTRQLAGVIQGSGVTVNAVHPGVIRTNLRGRPGLFGLVDRVIKRSWPPPEEGARAPVWLATAPELAGVNGKYFHLKVETEFAPNAQDDELSRKLWQFSAELSGIAPL